MSGFFQRGMLCVVVLCSLNAHANSFVKGQDAASNTTGERRPVVGLVLSGGGAKGIAHAGVLKVLEEMKIPIDIIVGTSAGASVGGVYAMGMPLDEIEERFHLMDWDKGLKDDPAREDKAFRRKKDDYDFATGLTIGVGTDGVKLSKGLIQGQQLLTILTDLTMSSSHIEGFDQFPIRYRAVASDIETGEAVAIDKGNLALAMRASMSIPGAFPPVPYEGRLLVDGGISDNLPVDIARELGAEVIIAVDISSPLLEGEEVDSLLGVVEQLTNLLTRRNVVAQIATLSDNDILITPDLDGAGSGDFGRSDELVEMGATSTRKEVLKLKDLSVDNDTWLAYQEKRSRNIRHSQPVDRIEIANSSDVGDEFISSRIKQVEGEPLDIKKLERDLDQIYGLGYFELVSYDIENQEGENVLKVDAVEKSWGPNYLRFGFQFEENFDDFTQFNLTLYLDNTAINDLGAELKSAARLGSQPFIRTEFYQPVTYDSTYFLSAKAEYEKKDLNVYENGVKSSEWEVSYKYIDLGFGREFGNTAELRLFYQLGQADANLGIGKESIKELNDDIGSIVTRYTYDSLDNLFLPHEGSIVRADWRVSKDSLGATNEYERASVLIGSTYSLDRYTLLGRVSASSVIKGNAGVSDFVSLGGLFNLSGYGRNELAGSDAGLLNAMVYREFGGPFIPYMLGFSFEMGNVWDDISDSSAGDLEDSYTLFWGSNTPIGPVTFAASYADKDHSAFYLTIGHEIFKMF